MQGNNKGHTLNLCWQFVFLTHSEYFSLLMPFISFSLFGKPLLPIILESSADDANASLYTALI